MQKIEDWIFWEADRAANLIARKEETAAESGWDPAPRTRPCEHRVEWMRGKLCLGCNNTNYRRLTPKERDENQGIDPYALDVKAIKGGFTALSNDDESAAQRRSAHMAQLTRVINQIERTTALREGREGELNQAMKDMLKLSFVPAPLRKIHAALFRMHEEKPWLYKGLVLWGKPISQLALLQLSFWVPGQIRPAPSV